jgi:hypothetical protein
MIDRTDTTVSARTAGVLRFPAERNCMIAVDTNILTVRVINPFK